MADETRRLRDELEILRDLASKVPQYEAKLDTYQKRLQEMGDLRRQIKLLEEKNTDYMQQNMELEEELKKSGSYRPQLDLYKKQVGELHDQLAEETKKRDKAEFDLRKLAEKMAALQSEKERLTEERDKLREVNDELKLAQLQLKTADLPSEFFSGEKLLRLQHENRQLRARVDGGRQDQEEAYRALLDDLRARETSLRLRNRTRSDSGCGCSSRRTTLDAARLMDIECGSGTTTITGVTERSDKYLERREDELDEAQPAMARGASQQLPPARGARARAPSRRKRRSKLMDTVTLVGATFAMLPLLSQLRFLAAGRHHRRLNQRILELQSHLEEGGGSERAAPSTSRLYSLEQELQNKTMQIGEMEIRLAEQAARTQEQQEQLSRRDAEMAAMEERYKKYLEKAKSVIRSLDPKTAGSASSPDVSVLRHQLAEKDRLLEVMEKESEKAKSIREAEERLITTAFYNFGSQIHRQAVEQRLSNISGGQSSFLARQRQANTRRLHGNSLLFTVDTSEL
ncbi:protein Hook homolog 3-like [Pollicipes pollicipes]|uniref:protein Hook homolog 3-like n=1 Tax=Pollicipes pollicipes TaxID=41117 RepID=UPI0018849381|nr:protein Hook homolog 3-like [Pollicipes pollicipes]